jgi:AraC family transcriptional regulator of adaptative response/methylated-DNA-[protein]-cysteine methyltransferase
LVTALPDPETCWKAVVERDPAFDGRFVFAVKSTGVYCRPSCASRRALRRNVSFHVDPASARAAGFRACRRCRPDAERADQAVATAVSEWCGWIQRRIAAGEPVTLEALGRYARRSAGHVQRTFRAAMGMSPKRYADGIRLEVFKGTLRRSPSVTDAIYDAGFGSSSRAYDGGDARLGMTPRVYRRGGEGETVSFTVLDLPELRDIGRLLIGATDRGLCAVSLGSSAEELEARLRREFPQATIDEVRAPYSKPLAGWIAALRDHLRGVGGRRELPLDLRTTALRLEVWNYLRTIPRGEVRSYSEVAQAIGRPQAVRAVANACAANALALVIPCHRVLRSDGGLGGYRWGVARKRKLLAAEGAAGRPQGAAPTRIRRAAGDS